MMQELDSKLQDLDAILGETQVSEAAHSEAAVQMD